MKRWSEKFLYNVCQPAIMETTLWEQSVYGSFDAKLKRLKANVILSNFIDRDEFSGILWDDMVDKSTENGYLNKMRHALDTMALTPMGKDILSRVLSSTYFGVAPMVQTGVFLNCSSPMIFLDASDDIFKNDKMVLRSLAHECTHAKNVEMEERACAYLLPPRLSFMKNMMNEISAYLSEDIVVRQTKNPQFTAREIKPERVLDIVERLSKNSYVDDFANRVINWHKKAVLRPHKEIYKNTDLTVFATYFKAYPALCHFAVIERLYQLYHVHVVKKARHQMHAIAHQRKR